jgi:hypothetical protein
MEAHFDISGRCAIMKKRRRTLLKAIIGLGTLVLILAIVASWLVWGFVVQSEKETFIDEVYSSLPAANNAVKPPVFYSCVYNESYQVGRYLVLNNQWNRRLMGPDDSYQQCIQVNSARRPINVEWTWSWPKLQGQVKAYPEIIYGWAPWLDESTVSHLPMRLSSIRKKVRFRVDFDTNVIAPGATYNTAFDLFLTSAAIPTPENRTHEIMIWVNDQNPWVSTKSTSYLGRLSVGGEKYDFWHNPKSPKLFIFRKVHPASKGTIVINHFLNYLLNKGFISADEYLADIEFGNEVISGAGQTSIHNYSVTAIFDSPR